MIKKICKNNIFQYLWLCLILVGVFILSSKAYNVFAGSAQEPDAIVSFDRNEFTWNVETDSSGCAKLDIFKHNDANVKSVNGDTLIAPGTSGKYLVRMCNEMDAKMGYTVLVYKSALMDIPINVELSGNNLDEIDSNSIPETLLSNDIIGAYQGTVKGGRHAELGISWVWSFEGTEVDDQNDTYLGNLACKEDVTYELRVLVISEADYKSAVEQSPRHGTTTKTGKTTASKTGDLSRTGTYLIIMILAVVIIILLWKRWRRDRV